MLLTSYASPLAMNGKPHFERVMAILSISLCPLASLMLLLPCRLMPMTVYTIILTSSASCTLTTSLSTRTPLKNTSPTFAKFSRASASTDYPASWRNVSSTHPHCLFLALLFHPQASSWTLIVSPPSSNGPRPKMFTIFRSSLALLTSTADLSTGSHALYLPSRFYFEKANGSTGPAKPNPHLTD